MDFLLVLSDYFLPAVVLGILVFGLYQGRPVYEDFLRGAGQGLETVVGIAPTIIGLMAAVRVLRASGFLELLAGMLAPVADWLHFPGELIPVALVRLFSSSAANGLVTDLFSTYGPDSFLGTAASVLMGCTESVFYTLSIYFGAVKVRKTGFTLAGALLATATGIVASVVLAGVMGSMGK